MKDPIREQEELELSRRFDDAPNAPKNKKERSIFRCYQRIQDGLSRHRIPEIEMRALAHRLAMEIEPEPHTHSLRMEVFRLPLQKWSWSIPFAAAILLICIYSTYKQGAILNPVTQISFHNPITEQSQSVPAAWEKKLQKGKQVQVPYTSESTLRLRDGSKLECKPGTELSIQYGQHRQIHLDRGSITVHAQKILSSTMTVETPLLKVEVTGTVFTVEILQ